MNVLTGSMSNIRLNCNISVKLYEIDVEHLFFLDAQVVKLLLRILLLVMDCRVYF